MRFIPLAVLGGSMLGGSMLGVIAPLSGPAQAQDAARFPVVIRNHRFEPAELRVPAGKAFVIEARNEDATAEEMESKEMGFEKVIPGGRSLAIRVRPLAPGRYAFEGEYNAATAQGAVVAE